jgi:putative salt-induced outer membrane protein YdiY
MLEKWFIYGLLALATVSLAQASSVVVTMKSGERLIGKIAAASDSETLILNSPLLGELKLPRDQVDAVEGVGAPLAPGASAAAAAAAAKRTADSPPEEGSTEIVEFEEELLLLNRLRDLRAPDSWRGNLRMGLNLSQGDSKWSETNLRGNLVIDPEQTPNFYRFTGSFTYRETERNGESVKSTDRYDGNFTFRRDLTEHLFVQNSLGGRVDQIRGIDHEIQELVGLGYRLQPREQIEFIFGGGGGVEDFEAEFEDTRNGLNPVANIFQEFTWQPFEKATFAQEFTYFINPEEEEQYNYVLSASFRYRLTDLLGIEFSFNQNFDNDVGDGNSKDDTRWRNAVIIYF